MARWFRYYEEALHDPKVLRLSDEDFRAWVNVLCVASKNDGRLPPVGDLALELRVGENACQTVLERLLNAGLIDRRNGGSNGTHYAPHGWDKRQFKSDTSTDRVKRYRERSKTVTETPPETETDTEKKDDTPCRPKKPDRGTRLPDDWQPTEADVEFGREKGFTDDDLREITDEFRDYWLAKPGPAARKLDWSLTWRNRVRDRAERRAARGGAGPPQTASSGGNRQKPRGIAGAALQVAARAQRQWDVPGE